MIKTTLIFMFVLALSSCKREQMFHFTSHDTLYFNVYDTLEEYTFHTNNGIDSLRFKEKQIRETYNEWYFNNLETSIFNASFCCEGVFKHNGLKYSFCYCLSKVADNQDPVFSIYAGARSAICITDRRNYDRGFYNDTIIIDESNSDIIQLDEQPCEFKSLKWHKYKGLVEYELSDGTIYKDSIN